MDMLSGGCLSANGLRFSGGPYQIHDYTIEEAEESSIIDKGEVNSS